MEKLSRKKPYTSPVCEAIDIQPSAKILTASNEGYDVDTFDPFNS